jgi:hypothetical protein
LHAAQDTGEQACDAMRPIASHVPEQKKLTKSLSNPLASRYIGKPTLELLP